LCQTRKKYSVTVRPVSQTVAHCGETAPRARASKTIIYLEARTYFMQR